MYVNRAELCGKILPNESFGRAQTTAVAGSDDNDNVGGGASVAHHDQRHSRHHVKETELNSRENVR